MKRLIAICLCLVMVISVFTGCGKSSSSSPGASGSSAGNDESGGDIIRYTLTAMPKMDPGVGSDFGASTLFVNIYDPLVMPTKDGSVEPWIATDWSVSEDGLTWTFKIRDDVKFHSGNPLTAKDVVYTMNRMLKLGEGFGYLFTSTVKEAVQVDDTTVQFVCTQANGTLPAALVRLYILDSALVEQNYGSGDYGEMGDYGKAFLLENDAGSGPYKVKTYSASSDVLCEQAEDYWAGIDADAPKDFKAIGSNESVTVKTMMQRKELEIADKYQSAETTKALGAMDGIDVMDTNGGSVMYLLLNNAKAPTDDVHVRKALSYMLDYDTICKDIFPDSEQAKSIISSSLLGYKPMNDYSYNLEKAKEEIAQSKYAKNIADYPIEVCWVAETPDREKLALLIQAAASQIGVAVNVVKTPWTSVVDNSSSPDTTPNVTTTLFAGDYSEAGSVFVSALRSKEVGTWQNCCWINDSELDAMIDDSVKTIDNDERVAKYEAIQDYLADKCVMIPLAEVTEKFAYQSSYVQWNAAEKDQLIPVMGYVYYMKNIKMSPDKK